MTERKKSLVRPSSIEGAGKCLRRWAFNHVLGFPEPTTPALDDGSKIHGHIEKHILQDTPFDLGLWRSAVAAQCVPFLPDTPKTTWLCEKPVVFDAGDYELSGTVDLRWTERGQLAVIQDWKTTSNLRYALSEEKLKKNPQMIVYGLAYLQETGLRRLRARWVYLCKKAPYETQLTQIDISLEELWSAWDEYHKKTVDKAVGLRQNGVVHIGGVPKDETKRQCYAYRRPCPYNVECRLADRKKELENMGNAWDDLFGAGEGHSTSTEVDATRSIGTLLEQAEINPPEAKDFDEPMAAESNPAPEVKGTVKELRAAYKEKTGVKAPTGYKKADLVRALEQNEQVREVEPEPEPPTVIENPESLGYGFDLCVYATPDKGVDNVVNFAEYIAPCCRIVEVGEGVSYWSKVPYIAKGCLAEVVRGTLKDLEGKTLYIPGRTAESEAVLTILEAAATRVYRGVG